MWRRWGPSRARGDLEDTRADKDMRMDGEDTPRKAGEDSSTAIKEPLGL